MLLDGTRLVLEPLEGGGFGASVCRLCRCHVPVSGRNRSPGNSTLRRPPNGNYYTVEIRSVATRLNLTLGHSTCVQRKACNINQRPPSHDSSIKHFAFSRLIQRSQITRSLLLELRFPRHYRIPEL